MITLLKPTTERLDHGAESSLKYMGLEFTLLCNLLIARRATLRLFNYGVLSNFVYPQVKGTEVPLPLEFPADTLPKGFGPYVIRTREFGLVGLDVSKFARLRAEKLFGVVYVVAGDFEFAKSALHGSLLWMSGGNRTRA